MEQCFIAREDVFLLLNFMNSIRESVFGEAKKYVEAIFHRATSPEDMLLLRHLWLHNLMIC